jgi:predicted small secreted protein
MRRHTISIAAAAAVTGLLLAACGNGATGEREDSGDTQPSGRLTSAGQRTSS